MCLYTLENFKETSLGQRAAKVRLMGKLDAIPKASREQLPQASTSKMLRTWWHLGRPFIQTAIL